MPIYTIDLSCRASGFDYTALFTALQRVHAQAFMDARWLIDVTQDLDAVTSGLLSHCAPGDGLFVTELAPETRWSGTALGAEAKAWFVARRASHPEPGHPVVPPKTRAARRRAA